MKPSEIITEELAMNGISIIDNFLDEFSCGLLIKLFLKRKERDLSDQESQKDSFSYFRWSKKSTPGRDTGVSRYYFPSSDMSLINSIISNQEVIEGISGYIGSPVYSRCHWLQENTNASGSDSTRDLHVDIYRSSYETHIKDCTRETKQVKTILYLSDVDLESGPFCHILNTDIHRKILISAKNSSSKLDSSNKTSISMISQEISYQPSIVCTARKGTLVISDVTLAHRGLPQAIGARRWVLSNSFYAFPGVLRLGF